MKPIFGDSCKYLRVLFILLFALSLSACNSSSTSNPPPPENPAPTPVDVNGGGVKGPLKNAILTVYLFDYSNEAGGFKGAVAGTGTTGDDAAITGLSIVPTGGPYLFEFTSDSLGTPPTTDMTTEEFPVISTLRTVVVDDAGLSNLIYGTPLTTAAVDLAIANADSSTSPYSGNNDGVTSETEFLAALNVAKAQVLSTLGFGLDTSVDIFTAPPILNANTIDQASQTLVAQYRTAIEAMTAIVHAMAMSVGGTADDMFTAVIADLADDSEVNGSPAGSPIEAAEIAIMEDSNPGALIIPNTTSTVDDVETILADERAGTGNGGIDPSPMQPVVPAPAETAANIDGDAHPDSSDNCPTVANDDQADINTNGIGDVCETPIPVPDIVGMTQVAAGDAIVTAGLIVGDVTTENSLTIAVGNVISQNPSAASSVLSGTPVNFVVSLGPPTFTMPDFIGMGSTLAQATIDLENEGVTSIAVSRQPDLTPIDQVIGQSPSAGSTVAITETINLTVSDGVVVPNVIGMSQADATNTIATAGLSVTVNEEPNTAPIGQVFGQSPGFGTNLNPGDPVQISVSLGIPVPVVVGMTQANATTTLQAAGFNVSPNPVVNNAPIGEVISQSITGYANSGTSVTIDVSAGVPVPDVVGDDSATATATLEAAGFTVTETMVGNAAPAGQVVDQDPNGATSANFGSNVTIFVSDGIPTTVPDISGIWRLTPGAASMQNCTGGAPGNARYLLTFPQLVQYVSISQPGGGNAITINYQNGISASGTLNNDGSLVVDSASRNWVDGHGYATSITYGLSGNFVAGAPDSISIALTDDTASGSDSCSQSIGYTAEYVYTPTGTENYNGTYISESLDTTDMGPEIDRESMSFGVEINGSMARLTSVEDEGTVVQVDGTATFDTSTGLATITIDEVVPDDVDGDGFVDDIEHNQVTMYTLFVRSDTDTSGAPTMVNMWYETSLKYQDTAVLPAPGTTPYGVDNIFAQGYGRLVQAEGFTMSNHRPINGGPGEEDLVTLGVVHPPLVGLDGFATNSFEIIEDASSEVRCSGTYATKYRIRETFPEHIPQADMALEEFLPGRYTFMNCHVDPANVIDNGAYTMAIRNSSGVLQHSIPITATPTTFATSITSRRQVNVNGALSSRTRRGDPIRLHGYFNSSLGNDLPVVVPVSTDPDIQDYRLRFSNPAFPAVLAEFISTTNSFVIPGDSIFDSEDGTNWDLTLIERYNRAGDRKAQSRSRKLRMQAGIRALVNSEIQHPVTGAVATAQFWLNGSNEFPDSTTCIVTRPLDGTLTCNSATINFATNTITSQVTFFGQPTTVEATFTDSVNASVVVFDPTGNWTGTARVVNPELVTRSQIDRNGVTRTDIIYVNPLAATAGAGGGTGTLTSALGQDLGSGVNNPFSWWSNNYSSVFNSFRETPLDGLGPQSTGAYRSFNTGSVLLAADTFTLVENGRTFRTNYGGEDPSSMLPPSRSQITIDFGAGDVSASTYSYVNQTEITVQPVTLSWDHTPSAAPADTRWQIRLREVLTAGDDHVPHSETRTVRLADGEGGLSFDPNVGANGRWTWTVTPDFEIPSTGIWKFNVRVSDPANTIRGIGQGVFMVNQVP